MSRVSRIDSVGCEDAANGTETSYHQVCIPPIFSVSYAAYRTNLQRQVKGRMSTHVALFHGFALALLVLLQNGSRHAHHDLWIATYQAVDRVLGVLREGHPALGECGGRPLICEQRYDWD